MTSREAAVMGAFTGVLIGEFSTLHAYVEEKLDHPVWTHEFANKEMTEKIKQASREDFLEICKNITKEETPKEQS